MSGWTPQERDAFETAFYQFLNNSYVNSKDAGFICIGENIFFGQRYVITEILDALEAGIHKIYILKSRQLGVTTIIQLLSVFYIGVHRGLKGALVFDTAPNKEQARHQLVTIIKDLPGKLKFPRISGGGRGNRDSLTLENDSQILFKSAGVKRSKSSGTLGRSVGLSFAHLSELCSYDNPEGLEAFEQSLSDVHPHRLYIYESTARGYNDWYFMYEEAKQDPHCKCIFLGFWAKDSQRIEREDPDFARYGKAPLSDKEAEKIALVRERYGVTIESEQWAWYRRKMDPTARAVDEVETDSRTGKEYLRMQEQPVIEEDSWQQAQASFFPADHLNEVTRKYVSNKYQGYLYLAGNEFFKMKVYPAQDWRYTELKVWEDPDPDGRYVLGCDPAYGVSENNDRSSIEVFRAYADGLDQVAEYSSALIATNQLAWVIASLLGWYGADNAQIWYALELNGPGTAVFNELRSLKHQIDVGYQAKDIQERGLQDVFRNVRTFLYTRPDALGGTFNFHIKTTASTKITMLERYRDYVMNDNIRLRSLELVKEMKWMAREGDTIQPPASKRDDRVMSGAFATHCWEHGPRKGLVTQNMTREQVSARKRLSIVDQASLFSKSHLDQFFRQKRIVRAAQQRLAVRQSWRYR